MKIRYVCAYIVVASGIFSFAGCSLWGPSTKGDAQFNSTAVEGQPKSLAGVYEDVDSNGSIKSHPQTVGEGGRINGLIILGGPVDMPDMKTGKMKIKEPTETTPTVKMGDTTFGSGSSSNGMGSLNKSPESGNK